MNRSGARRAVALLGVVAVVLGLGAPVNADAPALAPVESLSAVADSGYVTISWGDPHNADEDGFLVCGHSGTTPLSAPQEWCGDNDNELVRGTSVMFWIPPVQTWTYTVWTRDTSGALGPATSITFRGSRIVLSTVPSTDKAVTGIKLTGHLTDGLTGDTMAGQVVDVFATRLLLPGEPSKTGFGNVDVLMEHITTDANGSFQRTYPLRRGWDYQARYASNGNRIGHKSALVPADGSSFIDLASADDAALRKHKPRHKHKHKRVILQRTITLVAKVPVQRAGDRIVFQRMTNSRWTPFATRAVGASLTAAISQRIAKSAMPFYRAVLVQDRRTQQPSVPLHIRHG